jgi:3-oxoacyl-[acyl-carrier protein] reductase
MKKLANKVAIITGASKGIGAGIAKAFAAEGAAIVVNYAKSREAADLVVASIVDAGGKAIAVQADVSKQEQVHALFEATVDAFGSPDILVNNAGVFKFGPIESVSAEDIAWHFAANVYGTIYAIQEAVSRFGTKGGSIINLSSIGSQNTAPNMVVYSATKGAIDTITLGLSRELGARNIRVNSIAPGFIQTEGSADLDLTQEMIEHVVGMTPLGRPGQPEDVARIAVFLASDDAEFVTGERIMASGGWR